MKIKVKYIPNILSSKGRTSADVELVPGKKISDYLRDNDIQLKDIHIISGGKKAELGYSPRAGDDIIVINRPGEFFTIAGIFTFLASNAAIIGMVAIGAAVYAYSAYSQPKVPSTGSLGASNSNDFTEASPTYGWDGVQMTQDIGRPVPIVYGEHRTGGNVINSFVSTDGDKSYLNMLIALCEGEIDSVTGIQIDDNPIANFSDITQEIKYGTNDQTVVANFEDLHDVQDVNVQLVKDDDYVHTTVGTDIEGFELTLRLPNGLYYTSSTDGSINAWSVTYQVQYKIHTDVSYTDLGSFTISEKSRSVVRRIFSKLGLTAGQYDIKITRTSADSDFYYQGDLYLQSVDEIRTDDLAYPNTALLSIKALATEQLSGSMPNITSIVKGKKVLQPKIMNGETEVAWADYYYDNAASKWKLLADDTELSWDGTTYVTKWCANPAWCLRDLFTNAIYGLGDYVSGTTDIDDAMFLSYAKWCDEKVGNGDGGYEKRMRMDVVIDGSSRALDLILKLCSSVRAIPFYSNGHIQVVPDRYESIVQMFGMGNIIEGSFAQNWKSVKDIPNVIEVQYVDKDKNYTQQRIAVIDEESLNAGNPIRKKQIEIFSTRVSQALREGRYVLKSSKYIDESIQFKAGIDAVAINAGDVIGVSHDVPQYGFSGKVKAGSTTSSIVLDKPQTLPSGVHYIKIRFADDTIEEKQINESAGQFTTVTTTAEFSQAPALYDNYAIGTIGVSTKPYRVISLQRAGNHEVAITAVEHHASTYDDSDVTLPNDNYSVLTVEPPNVEDLVLYETIVKKADGTIEDAIDIYFNKPSGVTFQLGTYSKARIYLSEDAGSSWQYKGETTGNSFRIVGGIKDGGVYSVAVVSVNAMGKENSIASSPSASIEVVGKSAPPANVSTFLVNQSRDRLFFGWLPVSDVDLAGYEVRAGESWETGYAIVSNYKGTSFIELNLKEGVDQSFWIKAIDTSGNFSATATEATITIADIPFKNIIESYSEQTAWGGTKVNTEKSGDNLAISAGELTGTYETDVKDIGYIAAFKIGIDAVTVDATAGDAEFDDSADARWNDSLTARFSGDEVVGAVSFEIKISDDNSTWSDYIPWQAGDYSCRYFQIRMTLARVNTAKNIQCVSLDYYADLPDVDEFDTGSVTDAGTGLAVTFGKTFHEEPVVNINITSGDGVYYKTTSKSATGMTVKLYKADGTSVTGNFEYHAHGV